MKPFLRILAVVATASGLAVPAQAQARALTTTGSVAGQLQAVTCASSTECWAVGNLDPNGLPPTAGDLGSGFIEHWTGSAWQVVPSQNPPLASSSILDGIACARSDYCWAVGYYETAGGRETLPYAEHWNGVAWSDVAMPHPANEALIVNLMRSVSCPVVNRCVAVGTFTNASGHTVGLIERLTGRYWQVIPSPTPPSSEGTVLQGVSCASASECWATGDWSNSTQGGALADHSHGGRTWTAVPIQITSVATISDLWAVSCPVRAMCMAIGVMEGGNTAPPSPYVERWNGRSWVPAPIGTSANPHLNGVACATSSSCMAVGANHEGGTAVEFWNGTSWATLASPNPAGAIVSVLNNVACPNATNCWAVGSWLKSTAPGHPGSDALIEHWNGKTWALAAS